MNEPVDMKLYEKVKKKVYKKHPKHSAYRSGILVQTYKKTFKKKYGNKQPYKGNKTRKRGLARWFDEEWVNQRGEVGYKYKSDIYRPSKRITKKTPITHGELTKKEIKIARRKKRTKGRVKRFSKKQTGGMKRYGIKMQEKIVKIEKSPNTMKKYMATVQNLKTKKTRTLHFGASDYQQFRDSTKIKLYKHLNHGTVKRKRRYFSRHSGEKTKSKAVKKELIQSNGMYTPKILSHIYLW